MVFVAGRDWFTSCLCVRSHLAYPSKERSIYWKALASRTKWKILSLVFQTFYNLSANLAINSYPILTWLLCFSQGTYSFSAKYLCYLRVPIAFAFAVVVEWESPLLILYSSWNPGHHSGLQSTVPLLSKLFLTLSEKASITFQSTFGNLGGLSAGCELWESPG